MREMQAESSGGRRWSEEGQEMLLTQLNVQAVKRNCHGYWTVMIFKF
jgi:hypothetical protein